MKAYFDTNCIIYLLERNPQREALVIARIAALRAAGDELAVGDLSRAECLIGPFKSGDAGLEARYRAFFADPDVFSLPITFPCSNERRGFGRSIFRSNCPMRCI